MDPKADLIVKTTGRIAVVAALLAASLGVLEVFSGHSFSGMFGIAFSFGTMGFVRYSGNVKVGHRGCLLAIAAFALLVGVVSSLNRLDLMESILGLVIWTAVLVTGGWLAWIVWRFVRVGGRITASGDVEFNAPSHTR